MEFLRRRLGLIFRALVSLLFIYLVARSADWTKVWSNVRTMDVHWLVASFVVFTPVLLIVSWRWRLLLRVHGVHLRYWRVFELNMIGQFFSAFLVGTTGGDFVKIFYVARAVPQKKAAVAFTVVVDRVIGLVALLFFGVLLSFTQLPLLLSHPYTRFFTGVFYLFAVGGLVACIGATLAPIFLKRPAIRDFFKRLPLAHKAGSVFSAYERTAQAFLANLVALLVSLPSNVCITLMGYCIMRAMHLQPPLLAFCSILTMVNMLIALPISIAGLGVREQLFKTFLLLVGIDKDHAFTFSITFFVLNLAWSLVGGLFYLMYRHETHLPAPHVTEDAPLFSQI
jgi:uncharacterized protein (TIRG00374 family)